MKNRIIGGIFLTTAFGASASQVSHITAETISYPTDSVSQVVRSLEENLIAKAKETCGSEASVRELRNLKLGPIQNWHTQSAPLLGRIRPGVNGSSRLSISVYLQGMASADLICDH